MAATMVTQRVLGLSVEQRPILAYEEAGSAGAGDTLHALLIGVFHGDEGIAALLLNELLQRHALPPGVCVIPVLNPDGLTQQTRVNANRVDLNRNYPTANWTGEQTDSSYYGGPAPASEPETRLLMALISQRTPHLIVSVHSPYKVINFDGPARSHAERMATHNHYPVVESIGYPTPGSFGAWAGIERQIPTLTLELPDTEPLTQVYADNIPALWELIEQR